MAKRRSCQITDAKKAEMFEAWQYRQALTFVAKQCGVAYETAKKYRDLDKWDTRLARIKEKAARKADDTAADRRARHIKLTQLAQMKGAESLQQEDKEGKPIKLKHGDGVRALEWGVKTEREICGDEDAMPVPARIEFVLIGSKDDLEKYEQRKRRGSPDS